MNKDRIAVRYQFYKTVPAKTRAVATTKFVLTFGYTGDTPLIVAPGQFDRPADLFAVQRDHTVDAPVMVFPGEQEFHND